MAGLISRAAAIEAAVDGADDWDGGYNPERERYIREHMAKVPAVDAIPVEFLMRYAQMPTEFAISAWRKPEKEASRNAARDSDKPMSFDESMQLINNILPFPSEE